MAKLSVFITLSVNGYFADADNDMSWAHTQVPDPEWTAFVEGNASGGGMLLFGRVTYDLMTQYWPTPLAAKNDPVVAERMNKGPKVVFSRTLEKATWNNTRLFRDNLVAEVEKLKREPVEHITILGSGSIATQLAQAGLIDAYNVVISPLLFGSGRTMFGGLPKNVPLKLTSSRGFANGNVFLSYVPK